MVEIFDYSIRGDDTSDAGPALLKVGDTPCIAWKGSGNDHPNVMPIRQNPDGTVWFDTDRKITFQSDHVGGGIALGQNGRDAGVMWPSGNGPATLIGNTINENLEVVGDLVALGNATDYAPALCGWVDVLHMAWTGDDQRLHVCPLGFGDSGWEFLHEQQHVSNETSEYEPGLAWRPAPNRLYLAWTGEGDGHLNIMYCQGGGWADPPPSPPVMGNKHTISNEFSEAGPSILVVGSAISLAYRGNGNSNINLLTVDEDNNYSVINKRTSGHTTPYKPALASFWDRWWIAFTGEDDHLNLARVGR